MQNLYLGDAPPDDDVAPVTAEEHEEFENIPITNVAGWRDEAVLHETEDDEPPSRRRR